MKRHVFRIAVTILFGLALAAPQASAQMVLGGAEGDQSLYFFNGGSPYGESFWWDDSQSRFRLTDGLDLVGELTASGYISATSYVLASTFLYAGGNSIFLNYDGPDGNAALYFYEGSSSGRYLLWDDVQNRFEFNDSLMVPNNIVVGSTADVAYNLFGSAASPDSGYITGADDILTTYMEVDAYLMLSRVLFMEGDSTSPPDGDQTIYFADGLSRTGEYMRWDDSADEFVFSNDLRANFLRTNSGLYLQAANVTQLRIQDLSTQTYFFADQDADELRFYADGPTQRYYVDYDGDTVNNINFVWYNNGSTGAFRTMELDSAGTLRLDGTVTTNYVFTDLAERFVAVGSLEPGDLVMVSSETPHGVIRSRAATDAVLGVVSTAPGMELGGTVFSEEALETGWDGALAGRIQNEMENYKAIALGQTENGLAEKKANLAAAQEEYLKTLDTEEVDLNRPVFMSPEEEFEDNLKAEALRLFFEASTVPVALSGRVPVKVSNANGAIRAGDAIAAGSEPGMGVKATQPGFIVGTALEPLQGDSGKILVFINRTWYGGSGLQAGKSPVDEGTAIADGKASAGETTATATVVRDVGSRIGPAGVDRGALRAIGESLAGFQPVVEAVEVGDVLVADRSYEGWLRRSEMAADAAVVGIVTETDGVVLGAALDRFAEIDQQQFEDSFAPVAMSGIVRCKVDASYAAISVGDLLSTSPTPGHAMLAEAATPGTILGKALESMDNGTGTIRVLVMLR